MKITHCPTLLVISNVIAFGSLAHGQNYSLFNNFLPSGDPNQFSGTGSFDGINFTYEVSYTDGRLDPSASRENVITRDFSDRAPGGGRNDPYYNLQFPHNQSGSTSPSQNMLQILSVPDRFDIGPNIAYTVELSFSRTVTQGTYFLINNIEAEEVLVSIDGGRRIEGASIVPMDLLNQPFFPGQASIHDPGNFPEALERSPTALTLQGSHWTEANASLSPWSTIDPNTEAFVLINPNNSFDTLTFQVRSNATERLEFGLVTVDPVPEPSQLLLLSFSVLGCFRRKRS